ncbi:Aldo/keto reductase family protein [compost metagenome]
MAEALGLAATLWSPLGGGFLTGKYRNSEGDNRASKLGMLVHAEKSARETALLDTLLAVAAEQATSPTHVAIAWLREKAKRSTTALIPILGSRTREQLDATLGALNVQLSAEQLVRLDGVSDVAKGVPHESISGSFSRFSGGETLDLPIVPVA